MSHKDRKWDRTRVSVVEDAADEGIPPDAGKSNELVPRVVEAIPAKSVASQVSVGLSSTLLLAANARRKWARIRNTNTLNNVFIQGDGTAATTSHWLLAPSAEILLETVTAIYGIAGGGTPSVSVLECSY